MTTTARPAERLRSAGQDDDELLYRIYASTREDELAAISWDAAAKETFLRMQFSAQDRYYRAVFPQASFDLIVRGEEVLGRLYVDRAEVAWLVIDIALLPSHRGKGTGTRLLTGLLSEAAAAAKPVRMHVERSNQAQRLYDRLGFSQIGDEGVYLLLEWKPPPGLPERHLIAHRRRCSPRRGGLLGPEWHDEQFQQSELLVQ